VNNWLAAAQIRLWFNVRDVGNFAGGAFDQVGYQRIKEILATA
jgi:hypothetical protein